MSYEERQAERQLERAKVRKILEDQLLISFEISRRNRIEVFSSDIFIAPRERVTEQRKVFKISYTITRDFKEAEFKVTDGFLWLSDPKLDEVIERWAGSFYDEGQKIDPFIGMVKNFGFQHRVAPASPVWQFYLGWLESRFLEKSIWYSSLSSTDRSTLQRRFQAFVRQTRYSFIQTMGY